MLLARGWPGLDRLITTCLETDGAGCWRCLWPIRSSAIPSDGVARHPGEADAAVLDVPAALTSVSRDGLRLAQPRSCFRRFAGPGATASATEGHAITDEARRSSWRLCPADQWLDAQLKVTWPDDFQLMEKWL